MHECVCVCVCVSEHMPVSYHDGRDDNGAVFHAGCVVGKQRRVLDQHQFVRIVPVADLQGEQSVSFCSTVSVCSYSVDQKDQKNSYVVHFLPLFLEKR